MDDDVCTSTEMAGREDSHKVVLEEILQLSLSGRVGEVSNVESSTLGGAGNDGVVLRGVDGLVATSTDRCALGSRGGLVEGSVCHLGGGSFDGHDDVCGRRYGAVKGLG